MKNNNGNMAVNFCSLILAGAMSTAVCADELMAEVETAYKQELKQELTANIETMFRKPTDMQVFGARDTDALNQGNGPLVTRNMEDALETFGFNPESVDDVNEAGKISL